MTIDYRDFIVFEQLRVQNIHVPPRNFGAKLFYQARSLVEIAVNG